MVVDKINQYLGSKDYKISNVIKSEVSNLASWAFQRQFMENHESGRALRLSSAGSCPRKLAYRYFGFESQGKEIDGRAKIIFFSGDLIELIITELAKLAGVHILATGLGQLEVRTTIEGVEITGHPDGLILDNGKTILLEIKSMNDYRFKDFERGRIDDGYIAQVNAYMNLLKLKSVVFVALNKNNGVLAEQVVNYDSKIANRIYKNFASVIKSSPDDLPPRKFTSDKKTDKLPWQCQYCSFYKHCWPNVEQKLVGKKYQLFVK